MLSFKEWLIESAAGNYVSIGVETGIVIPSLEKLFGGSYVCDPKDQHVTLIYSKGTDVNETKINGVLHQYDGEIEVYIDEVAAFDAIPKDGQRDEDLCTIVIKLKSKTLNEIHDRLKTIGLRHSYPEFSPHISILYNFPRAEKERAMDTIREYLKENYSTVVLRGFKVEPIKEKWADERK